MTNNTQILEIIEIFKLNDTEKFFLADEILKPFTNKSGLLEDIYNKISEEICHLTMFYNLNVPNITNCLKIISTYNLSYYDNLLLIIEILRKIDGANYIITEITNYLNNNN